MAEQSATTRQMTALVCYAAGCSGRSARVLTHSALLPQTVALVKHEPSLLRHVADKVDLPAPLAALARGNASNNRGEQHRHHHHRHKHSGSRRHHRDDGPSTPKNSPQVRQSTEPADDFGAEGAQGGSAVVDTRHFAATVRELDVQAQRLLDTGLAYDRLSGHSPATAAAHTAPLRRERHGDAPRFLQGTAASALKHEEAMALRRALAERRAKLVTSSTPARGRRKR